MAENSAANGGVVEVRVDGFPRQITGREWGVVVFVAAPALFAAALVAAGAPISLAILGVIAGALFAPIAAAPFRRPVGVLTFEPRARGIRFPGSTAIRDGIRRSSVLLLLGPVEGLRLLVMGDAQSVAFLAQAALWFAGVGFFGLRRELRAWGAAWIEISREGVRSSFNAREALHSWEALPQHGRGPRALRHVLASPPSRKFFPEEFLAGDADVVARVIEFYRANPGARVELGTPAAVERLRRFDFDEVS